MKDRKTKILINLAALGILFYSLYFAIKEPIYLGFDTVSQENMIFEKSSTEKLKSHVQFISESERKGDIGLKRASDYILQNLKEYGINQGDIEFQKYKVIEREFQNIIVHVAGKSKSEELQIVGAHFDVYGLFPGADDNASGVAGLLEMIRIMKGKTDKDLIFVFYSSEEPPYFASEFMGSFVHAKSLLGKKIKLVTILEMIGYYSDSENSQEYPLGLLSWIYPSKGNFIALVSNFDNISTIRKFKKSYIPFLDINKSVGVESINAPSYLKGTDFSDNRNYQFFGFPTIMITDTSFYRNKNYHTASDTFDKLDYNKMSEVVNATAYSINNY